MSDYIINLTPEQELELNKKHINIQTFIDNIINNEINECSNLQESSIPSSSGMVYEDRGDCSYDFAHSDFTSDGQPHQLDLSGIVPSNATHVRVFLQVKHNITGNCVTLRTPGYVDYNKFRLTALCPARPTEGECVIKLSPDKKIEYLATNTSFSSIVVTVRGWYKIINEE